MNMKSFRILISSLLALWLAASAWADRVELADGSIVNGKILSAEGGKLKVETAFAGTIEIAQDKVLSFATDEAVNVSLASGSAVLGKVAASGQGITVAAANGQQVAGTAEVVAVWRQGADSPAMREAKAAAEKLKRRWAYEAAAAITGRTGGSEKFAGSVGFKATLAGPEDKLIFAGIINRAQENGNETANDWRAGVDYSSSIAHSNTVWYVRTDIGKDEIKAIDLRSNSAFGFGRKLVKNDNQDTEVRLGLGYVYETYTNGAANFSSAGLDVALINSSTLGWAKMNNVVTWSPSFKEFANYRLVHETSFDLPVKGADFWKLRFGVNNDYQSKPAGGIEKLDTTYFSALILNWK
ncbi:DUF481 domain-containing protein [Oleiharenicola lentus]|uniref:DUF481 domain-containing protein n=2 Tax=Oleiharenicola lentus TaxID=2508720 RepID=A0A4Q1C8H0_9BACT|nr:DUF481 domain-containing protein [Oleiharenicola lentus]